MINTAVIAGRLTRNAEIRRAGNGVCANFTLAVNRNFKTSDGVEADFINCVAWNKTAEIIADYTRKGSLIGVEGSIRTRSYENNMGFRVYVTEILVNNVTFLESRTQSQAQQDSDFEARYQKTHEEFQKVQQHQEEKKDSSIYDITDDDIAF